MDTKNTLTLSAKAMVLAFFLLVLGHIDIQAQDSLWVREYQYNIYNNYDLRISSTNAISTNRILNDVYRSNIKPLMNDTWGNISYGIYSFATTFLTMLWSHEFGHSLRARQVGGTFKIHNAGLPIPYTTMHLPADINYVDEALSVTGGFEVNYLTVRKLQREFIAQNGIFNEDLAFSFANRLLYPIYTTFIVRVDPSDPDVWINTAGDPVHCALPVFENYSNNQVFISDSIVNPKLLSYYNQAAILASFFALLDPHFYSEVGASFGKSKTRRPKFLIGDYQNGWTYGTLFNVSPLGYELYLNNYLHLKGKHFSFYAKFGNPFKNYGIGARWENVLERPGIKISLGLDLWDQDIFGMGIAGEIDTRCRVSNKIDLNLSVGYKSEGYVLGQQVDKGITIGGGVIIKARYL